MVSINVDEDTKKKFSQIKLEYCGKIKKGLNENEFVMVLIKNFEKKR